MSNEKAIEFLKKANGQVKVSYQWKEYCNTTVIFEDVPAPVMSGLSKVVSDGLVRAHGQSASQSGGKSQSPPKESATEGPITVNGVLYSNPTTKVVPTKKGDKDVSNFYIEEDGTRYSFGIWNEEGIRAYKALKKGDNVKVEGVLVIKDGKYNNIDKANLIEPDFKAKEEPPYEPPASDGDDIPF